MPLDHDEHPRRSLELDADALDRVAEIGDFLAARARNGDPSAVPPVEPDPVSATRVEDEMIVLRAWADLCRTAKEATPKNPDKGDDQ